MGSLSKLLGGFSSGRPCEKNAEATRRVCVCLLLPWQSLPLQNLSLPLGQVGVIIPPLEQEFSEWGSPDLQQQHHLSTRWKCSFSDPHPRSRNRNSGCGPSDGPVFTEPCRRCLCRSGVRPPESGGCWRIPVARVCHLAQGLACMEALSTAAPSRTLRRKHFQQSQVEEGGQIMLPALSR